MALVENDADTNPHIAQSHLTYIHSLPDKHQQYTRFLDALLVPRPSHGAFFRDLKGFRCLPTTIQALSLCDPTDAQISKEQRKENYRDVTRRFLGSRFAHPWCRKAMGGMGNTKVGGWWGAEWAATGKKMSKEQMEQEEKLHKLLVPIWIPFRAKMFPGDDVVAEWWEQYQLAPPEKHVKDPADASSSSSVLDASGPGKQPVKELTMATSRSRPRADQDLDDNYDDQDVDEETKQHAGTAATGLLRLAVAAVLVDSMPKMQKWKLKRELKRQQR